MASLSIVVPKTDPKTGRPKMVIMGSNGDAFSVPFAPRNVQHSGMDENVIEMERPGRISQIAVKNPNLHKMTFTLTMGRSIVESIEPDLKRLENIVAAGGWIQILYGTRESGLWKCTQYSYGSVEREPVGNQISRATVDFAFTEVPDARKTVAQYSNDFNFRDDATTAALSNSIVQTAASTRAITTPGKTPSQPYTVQSGDSLLSIAQKFYGQQGEQFWRVLADVNKVIGSLNIGQLLRIP